MKYILSVLVILGSISTLKAQKGNKDSNKVFILKRIYLKKQAKAAKRAIKYETYRVSGLSFGRAAVQDTRMALPVYTGVSFGGNMSWREFSEKWYSEVNLEFAYTNPSFKNGGFSSYNNFRAFSNISYLRKLGSMPKIYLGAGVHFVDGFRTYPYIGNSAFNNDLTVSINPEARYQNSFSFLKREINCFSSLSVNGFSYVNRTPAFSISLDGANNYFAPIGLFNRVRMTTGIHMRKKFSQENRMGLEYSWDFYSLNENDGYVKLRSAQHLVSLTYWFKTR